MELVTAIPAAWPALGGRGQGGEAEARLEQVGTNAKIYGAPTTKVIVGLGRRGGGA